MAPTYSANDVIARYKQLLEGPAKGNLFVGLPLIRHEDGSRTHLLGPCVRKLPVPEEFGSCFPRSEEEKLPFQNVILSDQVWSSKQQLRALPSFDSKFYGWYVKLKRRFQPVWRDASIDRALEFCCFNLNINPYLIGSAAMFWSSSTNCFFFRNGPMSVTLLDVFAITGLSPIGHEPSGSLEECPFSNVLETSGYGPFIDQFKKPAGQHSNLEHTAFLLYWLSKFVLCHLAYALSQGSRFALGRLALASLYRGLAYASESLFVKVPSTIFGPMWILQA